MRRYLVSKRFNPDEVPAYRATLAPLATDEEEVLADEPGRFVVARELTEDEVAEVRSRTLHIVSVELDHTASVPEPEVREQAAQSLTAAQARALHGIDKVLAAGVRGKGQRVGIIDTGIHPRLAERLGARVVFKRSFVSGEDWQDTVSMHGTWIASVIAAAAPEAEIAVYKGLSTQNGSGSWSGIIAAIEQARRDGCTQINLSLGGDASVTLDNTVNAADAAGIFMAVAAGNEQRGNEAYNADNGSPSRATGAFTVAAAQSDFFIGSFSSWGVCVDGSALGVTVQCADPDLVSGHWSGTSMAAPYLCVIAALLSSMGKSKAEVRKAIQATARNTSEPAHEEGYGFALADAAMLSLAPEPEEPGDFFPDLPRVWKSKVDDIPPEELSDFVMQVRGKGDVGVFRMRVAR